MECPRPWMKWAVTALRALTLFLVGVVGVYALLGLRVVRLPEGFRRMEPIFGEGTSVLVKPVLPLITRIERGDVVMFETGGGRLVGRIAGLPGEKVRIKGAEVEVGGEKAAYPYIVPGGGEKNLDIGPVSLGEGEYLVAPDDPWTLEDPAAGFMVVPRGALAGVVVMRF